MKIAIIYHKADFDGKLSNEVCRYHLSRLYPNAQILSFGWDYNEPLPTLPDDMQWDDFSSIFIVDISIPQLMNDPTRKDQIVWIDHHQTAIETWGERGIDGLRIDGVAACRLCWHWFTKELECASKEAFVNRKVSEPELIRLAGERDVWDPRDPRAKQLQFGLRLLSEHALERLFKETVEKDSEYTKMRLDSIIFQGRDIKSYCDKQNEDYAHSCAHTLQWEGLTWCALNIGQRGNSDLLNGGIKPEHQAGSLGATTEGTPM